MHQRSGSGTTTASRVKTLLLHVQALHGRAEADAFLAKSKIDRDYLADETRPLSVEAWHAALEEFCSRWGRGELSRITPSVVHPENLGVWTRVLRGTGSPAEAFRQLDQHGGDAVLAERWHTLEVGDWHWRGRVPLRSDASEERDGLCAAARARELAALPMLFGLGPASVQAREISAQQPGGPAHEFLVTWNRDRSELAGVVGLAGGAAATGAAVAAGAPLGACLASAVAGTALAAAGAVATLLERRRRAQTRAQLLRIQALERAAALRERREHSTVGFEPGAVIAGQYRLVERLGAGASGAIYEATRLTDDRPVAIKLLRAVAAHDVLAADRLRREAAALGLAWHPNVVELLDEGELRDGTSYLVMERLYGETLADRLRRVGALSGDDTARIIVQVCDALGAVHAAGVVHRDLKPSNIFLCRGDDDAAEHVKVLDFGVARVEWAETRLTNMGAALGTPGYMSPEQELGREIDARTDIYALGAVVYECLTAQAPPVVVDAGIGAERTSGVQRIACDLPEPWSTFVDRASAASPKHRFPDARAARDEVARIAGLKLSTPAMPRAEPVSYREVDDQPSKRYTK